jgi:hypothetical protein
VSKLSRLWNGLLPGLISLDPAVAIAYHLTVVEDGTAHLYERRQALVSDAPKRPRIELVDAARHLPSSPAATELAG